MRRNGLSYRAKAVLVIALMLMMAILMVLLSAAWSLRQENNERRAEIEPRIARLLGIQQQYEILEQANATATVQLAGLIYPATADATMTGTKMQQDVRTAIEKTGMTVIGSRVRAVKIAEGYDEVSLDLTIEGGMPSLEKALLEIPRLRPIVVIEETDIKPKRGRNGPHVAVTKLRLTAVRLQP